MELRINKGLSPNELGHVVGVSGNTVRLAEEGHLPTPRVQFALAAFFGKQPTDIWPLQTQVRR